ncbi:hypothetical protein, partial [Pseudoxanthomonas mexicana]|uniref:hypothetical protein n=1 Tax=Pseudoxanthomonas mexicana TaxID=128785 RepID=UPI003CCFE967
RKAGQEAVPIPIIDRRTAVQPRRSMRTAARTSGTSSLVARRIEDVQAPRIAPLAAATPTTDASAPPVAAPGASTMAAAMPSASMPVTAQSQAPAIAQGKDGAPVVVQPYHQNTATTPQASQAVQTSGRDDAFVF